MTEHTRMIRKLCRNPSVLSETLGKEKVWVRDIEHVLHSGDRIDIVAQDHPIARTGTNTTCYVLEIKSDKGDHEILGQLQKAILAMDKIGKSTKHWKHTKGISIAKEYTESGLKLLLDAGMIPLLWREDKKTGEIQLPSVSRYRID